MNEFVNPHHRGVTLPEGFKDLMDVLDAKRSPEDPELPRLTIKRYENGLRHVGEFLDLLLNSKLEDSLLGFMVRRDHFFTLRRSGENFKVCVSFSAGDLVFEKTLREIFAHVGIVPVSQACSPVEKPSVYCFRVPIGHLGEIVSKVLRACRVSDSDELSILLRAQ